MSTLKFLYMFGRFIFPLFLHLKNLDCKSVLSNMVATYDFKNLNKKFRSSVTLVTFHVVHSYMCLVATILDREEDMKDFHLYRRFF